METIKTALILGATGGIGGAIAATLLRHGWRVRGMTRSLTAARKTGSSGIEWIEGDAMRRTDVMRAADGASIIVHAVNPPNYMNWDRLVLPMMDNTIAAAKPTGARIVLPGTIYNFDPATTPVIDSDSVQRPKSRKGKIRVALEERLEQAAPDVPSLILRAGDFFGPGVRSSWFAQAMISPGKSVRRILNPARGSGHSWAYLPDLAETFAQLVAVPDQLRPFEVVQFEGLHDKDGMQMVEAIRRVCRRKLRSIAFPWWAMRLLAPFGGFPREAVEIAPYWRHPMHLDNTRLVALLGAEPRTLLDEAVRGSLVSMGCLEDGIALEKHVRLT